MTSPQTQPVEIALERPLVPPSGARASVLLTSASAASIAASYVFLLAAGRILGAEDYGALAALLGLLAVILLPAGALQMAVSREVSRRLARGDEAEAGAFARSALRWALLATVPLVALALALAPPLAALLHINSVAVVALAQSTLLTALVSPVAMGVLQGSERFHALASLYLLPRVLQLGLLAAVTVAGYRLGGAVFATVAATVVSTLVAVALVRDPLRRNWTGRRSALGPFLRYLGPVAIGLVGIALLTHIDILVVKARLSAPDAGAYAAASAFARVGFFLPATLLAVLFPRTAARHARGEATEDILGRSLLATAALSGLLALVYAAAGVGLVSTTFGPDFAEGGRVLAPFALATGLFSLANILVGYHLSRGETRYAWIVAAGVVVQIVALALVPTSLEEVVWTNLGVGGGLIAAHELLVGSSVPAIRAGLRHVQGALACLRAVLPEALLVLAGSTALVSALFWPVVRHLGSTVIGTPGSDATGSVAALWQMRQEGGYRLLGSTHHTLTGAPFGWDEPNGFNIQLLLTSYPAYLAAKVVGEEAALNLVVLSGYVLSAAAMYLLVRFLGCARLVAAWTALAYVVFPWHLYRAEHAALVHLEVLALLILALVAALQRPSWGRFALAGGAVLASWLTSGYFGAMAVITTAAFCLGASLVSGRRRAFLLVGAIGAALAATALVGIASSLAGTGRGAGLHRPVGDLSVYGLRPLELVVPPPGNIILGDRLDAFWEGRGHRSNPIETANYLGLVTIALALAWLVLAWRRRRIVPGTRLAVTAGLTVAFVSGLAFAAPSPILLFGHEIATPSRLLKEAVPPFRVPSRWDALLMTVLLPLAALGLQAGWGALARRGGRFRALAVAAVVAVALLSFLELTILPAAKRFRTDTVPSEYSAVERTPQGILAEYPLGYSDLYRLWQRDHGRPLLNGAPPDTPADQARLVLLDPAAPGTPAALSLLGVTTIVVHRRAHVDAEVPPREPAGLPGYRLVGRFPDGASVWQVTAPPAPALVTLPGGFAKPRRTRDDLVVYPLVSPAGVGALELRARRAGVVRLTFQARPPHGTRRVLRVADPEREAAFALRGRTRVSLLVALPRGLSRLLVKTDPAPTSEEDAIVVSAPRAEPASGTPALQAEPLAPDAGF